MINVEICYKTYDSELLIIIMFFKHWHHYLNGSQHLIKIFTDYNNLQYFISKTRLNDHQSQWFIMLAFYDFIIAHQFSIYNSADELFHQPDYKQNQKKVNCLSTLQQKFFNLFVKALCLSEAQQQVILNTYELHLVCISVLQYLPLEKGGQTEARAKRQATSPESSQIDAIGIQRKKYRFMNFNLKIQKRFKKHLLKLLKGYRDLQGFASKMNEDNLNDFRNNSNSPEGFLESLKDASEREIKSRDFNEDLDEDQLEAEWVQLESKEAQQRLSQHIIYNYIWEENSYSEPFSSFKSIVHSLQNFNQWIKKCRKRLKQKHI